MSSRKKKILVLGLAVIVLLAALHFRPRKPLFDLAAEDIQSIHLFVLPPEEKLVLTEAQTEDAVALLQNLRVSRRGYRLLASGGQTVKFTLILQDGTGLEVVSFGNAVIYLNGQPYKADYASAKPLSDFSNGLINSN